MRLYAYYIGHTILNTIKKIFRTWIAIFLMIIVMAALVGGVVGFIASTIEDRVSDNKQTEEIEEQVQVELPETLKQMFGAVELERNQIVELVVSGLFLFMLFFCLINSKGIGEIFQPADAALLFSAPIRPQSLMLFRLITTLGMQAIMSLFMLFQLPNLIMNAHIPVMGAVSLFVAWLLLSLFITLMQVLVYIISSYSEYAKRNIKLFIGLFFAGILVIYLINLTRSDKNLLMAAITTFTGANTYWVPFWGWTRGFCLSAITGNTTWMIIYLSAIVVGFVALIAIIWNLKVDFYEDALEATEKKAAAIESAKQSQNGTSTIRSKDRSEKIQRDGFDKGFGASVFYYKTIYNRRRLSLFRGITKTMLLYLGVCAFIIALGEIKGFKYSFPVICGFLVIAVFYRTLANPLREDITKELFVMVPEPAKKKLFWSLLGGLVNTISDMILPFLGSVIWLQASPLEAIVWFVFILTIDIYGTLVGTFIYISVGVKLSDTIQKLVQVAFIYFGILPAIAFVLVGLVLNKVIVFMPFGILLNLVLSLVFFLVTPKIMENGR